MHLKLKVFAVAALHCARQLPGMKRWAVASPFVVWLLHSPASAEGALAERLAECQFTNPVSLGRLVCYDLAVQELAATRPTLDGESLVQVAGTGNQSLDTFVFADGWQLEWRCDGDYLLVRDFDDDGKARHIVASQVTAGEGRSNRLPPGSYRLSVLASGDWELRLRRAP